MTFEPISQQIDMFSQQNTLDEEVMKTLENLKRMPATADRVWKQLLHMNTANRENQGHQGILAGKIALERLRTKKRQE